MWAVIGCYAEKLKQFESGDFSPLFYIQLSNSVEFYFFILWNAHETLINNNQPQGKNSIKNIRFCAVANCSSAYSPCTSLWRIRAPRNK